MSSHDLEENMTSDRLLSEIERQQKYLSRLPNDFTFPLFNSQQALNSQRRNGYRDTASAAREIVDNAMEAGAKRIDVVFDYHKSTKGKALVSSIAFIDDGSGMLPEMARYALSLGGGTHFDDPNFIGKFGFGLPNASINQTKRVEVYTRVDAKEKIMMAALDVNRVAEFNLQTIDEAVEAELPAFVRRYLKDQKIKFEHGTVVVWVQPDRLTYKTGAILKEHLLDDFGVTYRNLLQNDNPQDNVKILVAGIAVEIVDPLFLDERGRYYLANDKGGAELKLDRTIPVRYFRDPETNALHFQRVEDLKEVDKDDPNLLAVGSIQVRVARLPVGFAEFKKRTSKQETTDANRRFEIRQTRRGVSFVRAGREIETVDAFPRSRRDISSGLGVYPLLQGYAYHWGAEVKFGPEFDEVFGITNDKQRVRPIEDFWRLLHNEGIDKALRDENLWQAKNRKKKVVQQTAAAPEATPAEQAAAGVDTAVGRRAPIPQHARQQAQTDFEAEVQRRASGVNDKTIDEVRKAYEKEQKQRPYIIDFFDDPAGAFYEPQYVGNQLVVRINRQHPFCEHLYVELLKSGATRAKYAFDVFLIALAKAELETEDETAKLWYEEQRRNVWSGFLAKALRILEQMTEPLEEDEDNEEEAAAAA
jgi:hypothetical protein